MSVPLWVRDPANTITEYDWVVVGAGATGLSAALALQDAGESVAIIERDTVGRRASTRNAGYLMRGAADNYALACDQYRRERAKQLWSLTEENLAALRSLGVGSTPSYRPTPSCLLAFDETEAEELRRSHDLMREDGFACELRTGGTDTVWAHAKPTLGLLNPNDATCNPSELIAMLRSKFTGPVHEHTPVGEMREGDGSTELVVPGGIIRAHKLILCTNAFARDLGSSLPDVRPNRGQMLALRVPGRLLDFAYYSDRGSEYYRQADETTVVVGGRRKHDEENERTASESPTPAIQAELEVFAERILGERYPVTARWAGTMGFTESGLPVIAPVGESGRAWFVGGMNGHGMSMALRTAQIAVDHILRGAENPFPAEAGDAG